jgi:hypothetical protein
VHTSESQVTTFNLSFIMAANNLPIYSKLGQINWVPTVITTANTARDGTGSADIIFTADATNGGRVERVRACAIGTNVATVLRIFINNGSNPEVAANNVLYSEATCAATTASEAARLVHNDIPSSVDTMAFPITLPPGYRLLATIGTTVASGFKVMAIGGTY